MKRKDYQKPTMNIVELQQRTMLLAGSVVTNRVGYGTANEGIDPNELEEGEWSWD